MTGTNTVTTTTLWKRIFHIYVYTSGSGLKNAGVITVTNIAGNTTYLTIAAETIESDGADLWYPQGWNVLLRRIILCPTNQTSNARSVAVQINREYFDGEVPNTLRNHYFKASGEGSSTFESALSEIHVADEGAHSIFYESYLGGEMAGKLKLIIMMYNPDPTARGLNIFTPYT